VRPNFTPKGRKNREYERDEDGGLVGGASAKQMIQAIKGLGRNMEKNVKKEKKSTRNKGAFNRNHSGRRRKLGERTGEGAEDHHGFR